MELVCNRETLFSSTISASEKCLHLSTVCAESQETINIFKIYFCYLNGITPLFLIFFLIFLLILFKFICSTVEEYIAPAILYLSKYLNLSDALSGVTLLAFANGAGDVITAIVASDSKEGISYNVGSLYGAGFFVVTLVLALTIYNSPVEVVIKSSVLWRDCGFYVLASLLTTIFAIQGYISFFSSLMMLVLYFIYVLVVVFEDYLKAKNKGMNNNDETEKVKKEGVKESLIELKNKFIQKDEEEEKREIKTPNKFQKKVLEMLAIKKVANRMHDILELKLKHKESHSESKIEKIINTMDIPFHIIRKYTIPPCNDKEYNHSLMIKWPIFGVFFLFFSIFLTPSLLWFLIIPISILSYYYLKTNLPKSNIKIPSYFIYINLLGILCGILWTKLCCGALVDLLTVFGVMTGLSSTYLGLTIIAIGNALPDGLATISIAKQGQAVMGITGGIAGQLFGLLAGFGVSMMKKSLKNGAPLAFNLFIYKELKENLLDLLVIFVVFGTLLFIIFYGYNNKLKFDKKMGKILIFIYLGFITLATVVALYQALTE